jgi:phage terminase Nu1 subunit (DNA packaging protein)
MDVDAHSSTIPAVRRANKAEVALWFGVSLPAVDGWIRRGCPVVQRGARGVAWVLDLLAVAEWRLKGSSRDADELSPTEYRAYWQGKNEQLKFDVASRELIPSEDVGRGYSLLVKSLAAFCDSLPDVLERDAGLPPEALEIVQRLCDQERESLYQQLVATEDGQ